MGLIIRNTAYVLRIFRVRSEIFISQFLLFKEDE